jgi:hypothetical protein
MIALQFSWSAISAYCTHESGLAAQHLGHHQHQVDASEQIVLIEPGGASGSKKVGSLHSHCPSCSHAASTPAIPEQTTLDVVTTDFHTVASDTVFTSLILSPPERPQWRVAA